MKTTETKLIFPEFDTLAEYVRLEAINLDVGYKGEKGEKGDKGDKGDPGKDADIEGAKQAIERANGVIEALEKLELDTEQSINNFVDSKKAEIDSYLELQSLKQDQDIASSVLAANSALLAANKAVEDANASVINASNAAVNANNAAQAVLDEMAKIPPKLQDLLDTLIKAKGAVDAVNLVADNLENEVEKVLNINITSDGSVLTITDRDGNSSTINVLGIEYVITEEDYKNIASKVDCYNTSEIDNKFDSVEEQLENKQAILLHYEESFGIKPKPGGMPGKDPSTYITSGTFGNEETELRLLTRAAELLYKEYESGEIINLIGLTIDNRGAVLYINDSEENVLTESQLKTINNQSIVGNGNIDILGIDDLYEYNFVIGDRLFLDGYLDESKKILYLNNPDIAAIEDNKLIIE